MVNIYYDKHLGFALDIFWQTCEKFLLAGGFNTEETEPCFSEFLTNYDSRNLVKKKTYLKNTGNPKYRYFYY